MAHDPVVAETITERDSLEPHFTLPDQEARAAEALARYRGHTNRQPNVLMVLFDDVGWGDFGCYGGGVAVGAPTPNIDRLARRGKLLTSCYSEPSCTPSRASIMTGRLPMPTVLVVDTSGTVTFVDVHPDYTSRTEVPVIVEAVRAIV